MRCILKEYPMEAIQTINEIIAAHGGFVSKRDLTSSQYHRLLNSVRDGSIVRVRRGVFALPTAMANTIYDIDKIVPGGVLCNYTAWAHYGLTTQIPMHICVAIEQKRKIKLPDYPPIALSYQSKEQLTLGCERADIGGYSVNIFNVERSVCDALKNRNKIGMDVCAEIINNYIRRTDRNLNLLSEYAQKLRVGNILHNYLQLAL